MQKDVHFYLTYALAIKAGIAKSEAKTIAWADQYTDDVTEAEVHGIQTQSAIIGNWDDEQIQLSVLVPFHFIPGDDPENPWVTTPNCTRARKLTDAAVDGDPVALGLALHTLQDTFSHETFSGWREDHNSCHKWYYIKSALPNVGHAEMGPTPDVVNYVWTDPRTGRKVDNKIRAMAAAKETYDYLCQRSGGQGAVPWGRVRDALRPIFKMTDYDDRRAAIMALTDDNGARYRKIKKQMETKFKRRFVAAAGQRLADTMQLCADLPWL